MLSNNWLGNLDLALKTSEIFRDLVEQSKWADGRQLFHSARKIGKKLMAADRMNFTIGNTVKRVYHIIREECKILKISVKDGTDIMKGGISELSLTLQFPKICSEWILWSQSPRKERQPRIKKTSKTHLIELKKTLTKMRIHSQQAQDLVVKRFPQCLLENLIKRDNQQWTLEVVQLLWITDLRTHCCRLLTTW